MSEIQVGVALLAVVPIIWALMWWGWRARARRQRDLAPLAPVPEVLGPSMFGPLAATYVGSTASGVWLDRVVAHGLGARAAASVSVHGPGGPSGVLVKRSGAPDLWMGEEALVGARLDRAIAGKVVGADGLVVLTWQLGDAAVDSGVRLRRKTDRVALVAAASELARAGKGAEGVVTRG